VIYLALPELLHIAGRVLGPDCAVRDYGLLDAALGRPQATAFGKDAYDLIISVASGQLDTVGEIAAAL
jgi:death on curing protein